MCAWPLAIMPGADISQSSADVSFAPESGHVRCKIGCPLWVDTVEKVVSDPPKRNNRIRTARYLNRNCVRGRDFESMLRIQGRKIVFQQYRPKADICGAPAHVRFTPNSDIDCVFQHVRFGPTADSCTAAKRTLFDHLVSSREQGRGHREPKRLCGLEVDHQFKLGRQLNRKIARLLTFQYASDIDAGTAISICVAGTIAYQPTGLRMLARDVDCGNLVERRQPDELMAPTC